MARDTIFALSSGAVPAGVAVIRASGPAVRLGLETITGSVPPPRQSCLRALRDGHGALLDRGIVLFFAGPASFTGDDVAEFHVHGGRAVVAAILAALGALPGFRPADAGEFTRRAFENGKADLTEVEGLADLLAAETEAQRRQALEQAGGSLARLIETWRGRLVRARALLEAGLDFSDEADVDPHVIASARAAAEALTEEMTALIEAGTWGERVRQGFEVVLLGAPNVGKSSLLNALARRDAAIVTDEPGTTRDMIEVAIEIAGHAVTLVDTAGLREAGGVIEREGMRRARLRGAAADLVLLLHDRDHPAPEPPPGALLLPVRTKCDRDAVREEGLSVSARTGEGLAELCQAIGAALALARPRPDVLLVRARHRYAVKEARDALSVMRGIDAPELLAEQIRAAMDALGRLAGRFDVEEMLGVIFAEFCIGK